MNYIKLSEKILKHNLKNKKRITLSLIVTFLMTGFGNYEEIDARDLRQRKKEANTIKIGQNGPTLNESANGTDVININNPNSNGISHNKFIDLSVGYENGIIFNNSLNNGVSEIGGYLTKNPNLFKEATTILNEVTGNNISNINGDIEVFGKRADFILANENGINLNGATFINTNGVTLTTGNPIITNNSIDFNINKGNINLNGVGTSGNYFNVLAKTINIYKEISSLKAENDPNISLIAGENKITLSKTNLANPVIKDSKNTTSDKYGIYATNLGAMYGKNIRLISTDKGLGVRHEGIISSSEDIEISSSGDITISNLASKGNIKIDGKKNLQTLNTTYKEKGIEYSNGIRADKNIDLEVKGDIILNSKLESSDGNINITAKNLILKEKTNANINSLKSIIIKLDETLDVQGIMIPTISGRGEKEPPLLIRTDTKGNLIVKDPKTGKIYFDDEIIWVSSGISGSQVDIFAQNLKNKGLVSGKKALKINTKNLNNTLNGKIIAADGEVIIKTTSGEIINIGLISGKYITINALNNIENKGLIASDNNLNISTLNNVENKGLITSGNDITITSENNITNTGGIEAKNNIFISAVKNILNSQRIISENDINIIADSFISTGSEEKLNEYVKLLNEFSLERSEKVNEEIADLEKNLILEKDPQKIKEKKQKIKTLKIEQEKLDSLKTKIASFESLGVIEGNNIGITTVSDIKNNGIILTKEDLKLESKGNIISKGVITVGKNAEIIGDNFNNESLSIAGKLNTSINKNFVSKNLSIQDKAEITASKIINQGKLIANNDLLLTGNIDNDSEISTKGNIEIKGDLSNKGNIISNEKLKIFSNNNITNTGNIDIEGNVDIETKKFNTNGKINIGQDLKLSTDNFNNDGSMQIKGNTNIKSYDFNNRNELKTNGKTSLLSSNELNNLGKLYSSENIEINAKNLKNVGEIASKGLLIDSDGNIINSGSIQSQGNININNSKENSTIISNGEILAAKEIKINGEKSSLKNTGKIESESSIDINISKINNVGNIKSKNNTNLKLGDKSSNIGNIISSGNINIIGKKGDINTGKVQGIGNISISTRGDIVNNGMIVSNENIDLSGKNITNESGNTIWAGKDIVIEAAKSIHNKISSTIESVENMELASQTLINEGGTIQAGKDLDIKTDSLINKSNVSGELKYEMTEFKTLHIWQEGGFNHWDYVTVIVPNISNEMYIKDKASITSGKNLSIDSLNSDKANVVNESGTISAGKDIMIKGNLTNKTAYKEVDINWLLENIIVDLRWETRTLGLDLYLNSGHTFKGSLKDALYNNKFSGKDGYYEALVKQENTVLQKLLSTVLGADWKAHGSPVPQDRWNTSGGIKFYGSNANAQIIAGRNFTHSNGVLNNNGGKTESNKNVKIDIGDFTIDSSNSNFDVEIKDINQITQLGPIKQVHEVEIIAGEVTVNGVTIKAETGNMAGSIAVAGTINPIVFIKIPTGENGIFKPALPKSDPIQPLFETNIEFIDQSKLYGSKYFLEQIGYDSSKTTTVIGDAYYEQKLINDMIKNAIGYSSNIGSEEIKYLLDNALILGKELGLEIGKPLTPEQLSKLDQDIIWYVEIEINGVKALTPQLYFSKESRIKIAESQGAGGTSTIKAKENIDIKSEEFNNLNGNIVSNGNINIKSKNDITNSSTGGLNGGIVSNGGDIILDTENDINNIGGQISGNNVNLSSAGNIIIESTLGLDNKGNQIISDTSTISSSGDINITAKNNIDLKGAELKGGNNINLSGKNVKIEDQNLISSEAKYEYNDYNNYKNDTSMSSKSSGSNVSGKNIDIDSQNNITIKGSSIASTDSNGNVSIKAKNNVDIVDTKEVSNQKSDSQKISNEKGLVTVKWKNSEKNSLISKGSVVGGNGKLNISAGKDVNLKGSDLIVGGNTNIIAKNNINLVDGQSIINETSNEGRYQVLGGSNTSTTKYSKTSEGSSITGNGNININAKNNLKIINGNIESNSDVIIEAGKDVIIEAGKNEYHETTDTVGAGLYVDGTVGVGGVGLSGNANTIDMSANGEVSKNWAGDPNNKLDGSNEKTSTTSGKSHMDQLANSEIGVKIEYKKSTTDETNWKESFIKSGNNITIKAGGTADIGGGNYSADENISISADEVETTKYEDTKKTETTGVDIALKQSQGVTSSIADTINKSIEMDNAIKSGEANDGIIAAQGIGTVTNIIFNDLIGVFSKQSANLSVENTKANSSKENTTSLNGKNISIEAKKGDITLNGVDIKASENISLDAKENINISASKETNTEEGFKVDLEAQLEETAGYSALWGGNTDIGVGGSINVDATSKNAVNYTNSSIQAGGNISLKSGKDTNIKGGNISSDKDTTLDIGGSLNIESMISSYNEESINANAGGNVSIGASSNTIGKGELGFNAGGGNIWKSGETVVQSGITSGGSLNVTVKNDLNMKGAILGSEIESGSLDVGGNVSITDISTFEKQGGAQITISGGLTGDMGIDGQIGDMQNKEISNKSVIGLKKENISVKGDININGEESTIENIYMDLNNTQLIEKNEFSKGGSLSLTGSMNSIKEGIDKGKDFVGKGNKDIVAKNMKDNDIYADLDTINNKIQNRPLPPIPDTNSSVGIKSNIQKENKDTIVKNMKDNDIYVDLDNLINNMESNRPLPPIPDANSSVDIKSNIQKENANTNSKDKYSVLDKENAFDFPKDNEIRELINDTAKEEKIIPEKYFPLNTIPEEKGNNAIKNILEKKEQELKKKEEALNIPNMDSPIVTKAKQDVDKVNKELDIKISKLDKIQKEQNKILKNMPLSKEDRKKLETPEKQIDQITKEINKLLEEKERKEKVYEDVKKSPLATISNGKLEDIAKAKKELEELKRQLEKNESEEIEVLNILDEAIKSREKNPPLIPEKPKNLQMKNEQFFKDHIKKIDQKILELTDNSKELQENTMMLEKKIASLEKDLGIINNIEKIVGESIEINSIKDDLILKIKKEQEKLDIADSKQLEGFNQEEKKQIKELSETLDRLGKEQENILKEKEFNEVSKEKLDKLEKEMKEIIENLNEIKNEKRNETLVNKPLHSETFKKKTEVSYPENINSNLTNISVNKAEKNNNNLESNVSSNELGTLPLVYGTSKGREELVKIGEKSPNKNNNVADSYLGELNLGMDFIQLGEFSKKYTNGTLTENDLEKIINFKDSYFDNSNKYIERQMSSVSPEANKELINLMLGNEKVQEVLKQIGTAQEELFNSEDRKEVLENFNNLAREFFSLKTKIVLEKTFERDGQVYFSLNQVIMGENGEVDFNKLKDVFNKNNLNYNSVTSEELRFVLKNYLDHPNLKFLLNKQVIEIPLDIKNDIINIAKEGTNKLGDESLPKDNNPATNSKVLEISKKNINLNRPLPPIPSINSNVDIKLKKSDNNIQKVNKDIVVKNMKDNDIYVNLDDLINNMELNRPLPPIPDENDIKSSIDKNPNKENEIILDEKQILLKNQENYTSEKEKSEKYLTYLLKEQQNLTLKSQLESNDKKDLQEIEKKIKETLQNLNTLQNKNLQNLNREEINLQNKTIDEALKETQDYVNKIEEQQSKLINKYKTSNEKVGKKVYDENINKLKSEIKSYIEKNRNEDVTLSKKQKETIEKIVKRINDLEEKNNSELSGRGEKKSSLNEDLDLITRSDKNIADNLKKIAEKSNQIPKEHLLDYLDRLILNSDTEAISDQLTGEKHETIVENPVLNLSDASEADLNKIYQDIMRQTDNGLREILDNSLEAFLIEDQKVKNFLNKKELTIDDIKTIAERVQNIKAEIFEDTLGVQYEKSKIVVEAAENTSTLIGGNTGKIFSIFLRPKDDAVKILTTIVHELTHQDQQNLKNLKIEGFEDRNKLYELNGKRGGYIETNSDDYRSQPVEKEAFDSEKIVDNLLKNKETVIESPLILLQDNSEETKNEIKYKESNSETKRKKKINETKEIRERDQNNINIITRSSKDTKNNLKKVASEAETIPSEHLNNYLGKILLDSDLKEIQRKNKANESIIKNPSLNMDSKTATKLEKIYSEIYNKAENNLSNSLDSIYLDKLKRNDELQQLLSENKVTKENILKLAKIVEKTKEEAYKEVTGESYDVANITIKNTASDTNGELQGNMLTLYIREDSNLVDYLGTLSHEYKHNDQRNLRKDSLEKGNIPYLYTINSSKDGYIEPDINISAYKNQPIEKEAFEIQKKTLEKFKDGFIDSNTIEKLSLNTKDKITLKINPNKLVSDAIKNNEKIKIELENSSNKVEVNLNLEKIRKEIIQLEKLKKLLVEKNRDGKYINEIKKLQKEINNNYKLILNTNSNNEHIVSDELTANIKPNKSSLPSIPNINKSDNKKYIKKEDGYIKNGNEITRTNAEIKKQLEIILNSGKDIPADHLQDFLGKVVLNKELTAIENNPSTDSKIIIKNEYLENLSPEDKAILYNIYQKIPNKFEKTRERMNNELIRNMSKDKELINILFGNILKTQETRDSFLKRYESDPQGTFNSIKMGEFMESNLSSEDLRRIAANIQKNRKSIFEKFTNIEYKDAEVKVLKDESLHNGYYGDKEIKLNLASLDSPEKILDTILHESTHLEQDLIRESPSGKVGESIKELYNINHNPGGYIKPGENVLDSVIYRNQPVEAEAFYSMRGEEVLRKMLQNIITDLKSDKMEKNLNYTKQSLPKARLENMKKISDPIYERIEDVLEKTESNNPIYEKIENKIISKENQEAKYSVLDKENAFDFPKDDRTENRELVNDIAGEKKIISEYYIPLGAPPNKQKEIVKIEHKFKKETGNLEDPYLPEYPSFAENVLIYGASENESGLNRDELVLSAKTNGKGPLVADAFLDSFNSHRIPEDSSEYATEDYKKLMEALEEKGINMDDSTIRSIVAYKPADEDIEDICYTDKVNTESNVEILKELLKNEEVVKSLEEIDRLNKEISTNKNLNEGKFFELSSEDRFLELSEEIEQHYKIFFKYKTILIADKTLKNGGKIYFVLNGVATSTDSKNKIYFDENKLENILFNKEYPHYNSVTSEELRFLFKNYKNNKNLKFLINGQVIDLSDFFTKLDNKYAN